MPVVKVKLSIVISTHKTYSTRPRHIKQVLSFLGFTDTFIPTNGYQMKPYNDTLSQMTYTLRTLDVSLYATHILNDSFLDRLVKLCDLQ